MSRRLISFIECLILIASAAFAADSQRPQIHGPKIRGVRPGHPFIYRIPATGGRPMTFSVSATSANAGCINAAIQTAPKKTARIKTVPLV